MYVCLQEQSLGSVLFLTGHQDPPEAAGTGIDKIHKNISTTNFNSVRNYFKHVPELL